MVFKAKSFPIALTLVIAKDTISDKFSYCWHLLYFCRIILRLTKSSDMTFRVIKLKRHGLIIFLCFVYFIFIEFCNMMFTMSIFFSACIYRSYAHFVALNKRFILVTCHHSATLEFIHFIVVLPFGCDVCVLYLWWVLLWTGSTSLYKLWCMHGKVFLWDLQVVWWWCKFQALAVSFIAANWS